MKIGYFTDLHARADTPEGRSDDFRTAILAKVEQMGDIWKKHEVECVLFGGDLFHTPDPATSIVNDTFRLLRRWNKDIVATIGNHDYFGFQMRSLKRTALGLAHTTGVLFLIPTTDDGDWQSYGITGKIRVVATPHTYWVHENPQNFTIAKSDGVKLQIQLVHADLFNKAVIWPHTTIDAIHPYVESDIVLSGHIHAGWDAPIHKDDKVYYNPGSICRLENTGQVRIPRVCVLDIDETACTLRGIETIELEVERHPFKEKAPALKPGTMRLAELADTIEKSAVDVADYKAWMPEAAKKLGIKDVAIDRAFSYIEQV